VDENSGQLGVVPTDEALRLAYDRGFDLVEVAPGSDPPVCRLLDYGRFRYLQTKREREAHRTRKTVELCEVRFRPRIGAHDWEYKVRSIRKLLNGGDKVKVSVRFRGREITHPELGVTILKGVAEALEDIAKLERPPMMEGRYLSITLASETSKELEKAARAAKAQEDFDAQNEDA